MRALTLAAIQPARATLASGTLPEPDYAPRRCDACSLLALCSPKFRRKVSDWFVKALTEKGVPE